ncbi:MAG: DUF222 domain-containing protein [Dietzia sp.]
MADQTGEAAGGAADSTAGGPTSGSASVLVALRAAAHQGWAAENRAAAGRLVACYQLLQACLAEYGYGLDETRPGYAVVDGHVAAAGYVVAEMNISARRAETMLTFAWDLHTRYPAILEAMAAGLMEQRVGELLARQMATVHVDVLEKVQRQVVDEYLAGVAAGIRLGEKGLRDNIDAIIGRHDPDGIRLRKADASRARGVRFTKGADGMSNVSAILATEEAAVLAEALDHRVAEHDAADAAADAAAAADASASTGEGEAAGPEVWYTKPERRADALMSLVCGDAPGHTGSRDTADSEGGSAAAAAAAADAAAEAAAGGRAPVLRPKVTVIATGQTGRDQDGVRVEFTRTGEAALATLLEMLATCDGASVEQVDPTIGAADQPGAELKYRPGAELARRVRLRDGTCRHPGCTVPAEDCDLDHVVPFDHADPARGGLTVEANLMAECRRHHRFKTFSDWRYRLEPDGTLVITTPDGASMITRPEGPLAQYRREQQRAEADAWARQQRRNSHPHTDAAAATEQATYFTRRAQRLNRERTHAATSPGSPTTSPAPTPAAPKGFSPADDSRWWQRNKPHHSTLEHAIRQALLEHLEKQLDQQLEPPPPF